MCASGGACYLHACMSNGEQVHGYRYGIVLIFKLSIVGTNLALDYQQCSEWYWSI